MSGITTLRRRLLRAQHEVERHQPPAPLLTMLLDGETLQDGPAAFMFTMVLDLPDSGDAQEDGDG